MFHKRTQDLKIKWAVKYDVHVPNGGMVIGNDESIYFTTFSNTVCNVGKLSSSDGSVVTYNTLDGGVVDCNKIAVSQDQKYVYVTGNVLPHRVIELTESDFSFVHAFGISSDVMMDLKAVSINGDLRTVYASSFAFSTKTLFTTYSFTSQTALTSYDFT